MIISGPITRRAPGGREIVLADVDAVSTGGDGDVGAVVDHEERAVAIRGGPEVRAPAEEVTRLGVLLAQLDDVGAGFEHGSRGTRHDRLAASRAPVTT